MPLSAPVFDRSHKRWKKMRLSSHKFFKSSGFKIEQTKQIRTDFPETWIWTDSSFKTELYLGGEDFIF
jgi:hypothetical protein